MALKVTLAPSPHPAGSPGSEQQSTPFKSPSSTLSYWLSLPSEVSTIIDHPVLKAPKIPVNTVVLSRKAKTPHILPILTKSLLISINRNSYMLPWSEKRHLLWVHRCISQNSISGPPGEESKVVPLHLSILGAPHWTPVRDQAPQQALWLAKHKWDRTCSLRKLQPEWND